MMTTDEHERAPLAVPHRLIRHDDDHNVHDVVVDGSGETVGMVVRRQLSGPTHIVWLALANDGRSLPGNPHRTRIEASFTVARTPTAQQARRCWTERPLVQIRRAHTRGSTGSHWYAFTAGDKLVADSGSDSRAAARAWTVAHGYRWRA